MKPLQLLKIEIAPNRIYGLDIMRAFAIGFVLYGHNLSYLNKILPSSITRWFLFDGVTLFFVLSGFLIGGILLKVINTKYINSRTLLNFWKRRWLRTLPNYYLILSILTLYHLAFRDLTGIPIWKYYLFIQNLNWPHPLYFEEAWSLSIEEWFYIIVPLSAFALIGLFKTSPKKAFLVCTILILLFATYMRWIKWQTTDIHKMKEWSILIRTQILTRLDSLIIGVLAAVIAYYYQSAWIKWKKTALYIGLTLFVAHTYFFNTYGVRVQFLAIFGLTLFSLSAALLLPYLSELKRGKGFLFKAFTYVSLTSYSAYLINVSLVKSIVLYNLSKIFPAMPQQLEAILLMLLFFTFTFTGSTLLYKYFELPIMKLRDKK